MGNSTSFVSRGHTDGHEAMEKTAIVSCAAPHFLSYLSTPLFSVVSVQKDNWHQPSGRTDAALEGAGTREHRSQGNGQTAGRLKRASTPSPVFEEVVQLK